jgi:hypothetical protein
MKTKDELLTIVKQSINDITTFSEVPLTAVESVLANVFY